MYLFAFLLFLLSIYVPAVSAECFVTPCTRDIILVVDCSSEMIETSYVDQQIQYAEKLAANWTISSDKVRVAVFGNNFANGWLTGDYMDSSVDLRSKLSDMITKAQLYGLFAGTFHEAMQILYSQYASSTAEYPSREGVQKRIIFFTPFSDQTDISSTASVADKLANAGFELSLIGIGTPQTAYSGIKYHKFFYVTFDSLANLPDSLSTNIVNQAICFWDANRPQTTPEICPTTTTPAGQRTTRGLTTHIPLTQPPIDGKYVPCSTMYEFTWLDVVLLIDVSNSIGGDIGDVAANVISLFAMMNFDKTNEQHVNVAIVTMGDNAKVVAYFDDINDVYDLIAFVDSIEADGSTSIAINSALGIASQLLRYTSRDNAQNVVIVYSTAFRDDGANSPLGTASSMKESGTNIMTIAFVDNHASPFVLKMGEIASPLMNFTNYQNDFLYEQMLDGLSQANCVCPNEWQQLIIKGRRYGECYFLAEIDTIWTAAKAECEHLPNALEGSLVFINSQDQQNVVHQYASKRKLTVGWEGDLNYHIGLQFQSAVNKYVWVNGEDVNIYNSWDIGYPDNTKGNCVRSYQNQFNANITLWRNVDCNTVYTKPMCMAYTCDMGHYCASLGT